MGAPAASAAKKMVRAAPAPIIRPREPARPPRPPFRPRASSPMTLPAEPDRTSSAQRRAAAAAAGRAWLLAALARLVGRRPASQPAGVTLLENGRNDGPPDLDELWRDFNRKLSGLFSGRGGARRGNGGGGPRGGHNFTPTTNSAGG